MKTFDITSNAMCGEAYNNAIMSIIDVLNTTMGTKFFYSRDWVQINMLAERLGVRFDENGNVVK